MNVTLVEINIKPERVDEFLEVFRANHEGALQEPGNLRCCGQVFLDTPIRW
ncbi:Autoinducer 2 (AI-2) modifying protein LsrG [Klebsiella pneumoniae]|nr:Autoinducer 2 (AI-2) modifying protein LsrG [Klebsiella pneumoniae]